jgi:hypothetical protein
MLLCQTLVFFDDVLTFCLAQPEHIPLDTGQETYANKTFSSLVRGSEALELFGIAIDVGHVDGTD